MGSGYGGPRALLQWPWCGVSLGSSSGSVMPGEFWHAASEAGADAQTIRCIVDDFRE